MKKSLTVLLAASGISCAVDTQLFDLTQSISATESPFFYNASTGKFTENSAIEGDVLSEKNGSNQVQTNISFTLNLTAIQNLTEQVSLINMDMANDVGLALTSTGLTTTWNGSADSRQSVTYTNLSSDAGVFTADDGNTYITLTMVQTYGSGVQVYSNNAKWINDTGLKGNTNTQLVDVTINSDYMASIQFSPGWLTGGDSAWEAKNLAFDTAARPKIVPEPATATLSLLALAGLCARRRRK